MTPGLVLAVQQAPLRSLVIVGATGFPACAASHQSAVSRLRERLEDHNIFRFFWKIAPHQSGYACRAIK